MFAFVVVVINQVYEAEITPNEYIMRGNAAIIKCLIPSFVADFVQVSGWLNEEGEEISVGENFREGKQNGIASSLPIHCPHPALIKQ